MPIWIPIIVMVVTPIVVWTVGDYIGMGPTELPATVLLMTVEAAATVALVDHLLIPSIAPHGPQLPGWADWLLVVGVPLATILTLTWEPIRAGRDNATPSRPAGHCRRCGADLHADHAGRYLSSPDGYLCPPDKRQPDQRRHQFEVNSVSSPS